jgi:hypothetical protein
MRGPSCVGDAGMAVKHTCQVHAAVCQLRVCLRHEGVHLALGLDDQRHCGGIAGAAMKESIQLSIQLSIRLRGEMPEVACLMR